MTSPALPPPPHRKDRMVLRRRLLLALAALLLLVTAAPADAKTKTKHGVSAKVSHGTLRITGDRKSNTVTLRLRRRHRGTLEIDTGGSRAADFSFNRAHFKRIVVNAGKGNDRIRVDDSRGAFTTAEKTTLNGGAGNDHLT